MSRFDSPWANTKSSGPPQKFAQAEGGQGGPSWSTPALKLEPDMNRFGTGPPAKMRREEPPGQMQDPSGGRNWSKFDSGDPNKFGEDQNRFGNQSEAR